MNFLRTGLLVEQSLQEHWRNNMSEDLWRQRAETAEAKLITLKESLGHAIDRVKIFKTNFGIKERSNGDIDIDYDKFTENLGIEAALELRKCIDQRYIISGEAGDKPRIKLVV